MSGGGPRGDARDKVIRALEAMVAEAAESNRDRVFLVNATPVVTAFSVSY
jgi:uncharacterized protein YkuJ